MLVAISTSVLLNNPSTVWFINWSSMFLPCANLWLSCVPPHYWQMILLPPHGKTEATSEKSLIFLPPNETNQKSIPSEQFLSQSWNNFLFDFYITMPSCPSLMAPWHISELQIHKSICKIHGSSWVPNGIWNLNCAEKTLLFYLHAPLPICSFSGIPCLSKCGHHLPACSNQKSIIFNTSFSFKHHVRSIT